jgi:hypothetical protein
MSKAQEPRLTPTETAFSTTKMRFPIALLPCRCRYHGERGQEEVGFSGRRGEKKRTRRERRKRRRRRREGLSICGIGSGGRIGGH